MKTFENTVRCALLGALVLGVVSCDGDDAGAGDAGGACGNPAANPECRLDLTEAECAAKGGDFGIHGDSASPSCLCPTSDAGCTCQGADDCEAGCQIEGDEVCEGPRQGVCAAHHQVLACFCRVEDGRGEAYICP